MSHVSALSVILILVLGILPAVSQDALFIRGDANADGVFDLSDSIFTLRALFLEKTAGICDDAADTNDDDHLDIADPIFGLRSLFMDGASVPPPATCGIDPTEDGLGCSAHEPCKVPPLPCLDPAALDSMIGMSVATSFCLPAGMIEIPADRLSISICPESGAQPCGSLGTNGCPVELTSIAGRLDAANARVVITIQGRIVDLPVEVTESLLGTTTTCTTDFHGAAAGDPFSFDLVIPFVLKEEEPGIFTVQGTDPAKIENVVMNLTAEGNLVCRLFQAAQGIFVDLLVALLEQTLAGFTSGFEESLAGSRICIEGR